MSDLFIRFLICNVYIAVIIGLIFIAKRFLRNVLTNRMQYHLWYVMLALLAIPFLPVRLVNLPQFLSWLHDFGNNIMQDPDALPSKASNFHAGAAAEWLNDFSISVSRETSSYFETLLLLIWLAGILAMVLFLAKSRKHLQRIKHSALPLQSVEVRSLYQQCLHELGLKKKIPIYSTAFLKSPILTGLFHPCIYLPIHLISDYNATDMRYMLLHELQHYKHKDTYANNLMNLAIILYWFNPCVWLAFREMQSDREIACDTSVLQLLDEIDYIKYGNALINFAEKVSSAPFPFSTGIGGTMEQIKKRILNISCYKAPTFRKRLSGTIAFTTFTLLLFGFSPVLSIYVNAADHYEWGTNNTAISYVDYSAYFQDNEGCFILYNLQDNAWEVYNKELAIKRIAPDSTYKIYDALWGLESEVITPENSTITWNQENHPFDAWNADQDINSAMKNSVNWYFQNIDSRIGQKSIQDYITKIQYGNQDISGGLSSYWLESSLKISPIEQVELLKKFYKNEFGFSSENIQAVKDALYISASFEGNLYGKTGTGQIDGNDINGWFIGYVECADNTYFFAVNIQGESDSTGANASKIAMRILSTLKSGFS